MDGVDRAFFLSRHVAQHIHHRPQVLAVAADVDGLLLDVSHFRDRNLPAACSRHPHRSQRLDRRTSGPVELHANGNVLARLGIVQQACGRAVESNVHGLRHRCRRNPVQRGLVEVHLYVVLHLRVLDIPVHIHHAGRRLEDLLDLLRQFDLLLVIGTVHFGDQRLEHRWAGRYLGDLQPRAILVANLNQARPQPLGDLVALRAALVPVQQVYLDVGLIGAVPQEVMPHQPVEVVRAGSAGVDLVVLHLRLLGRDTVPTPAPPASSAPAWFRWACQR